MFSNNILLEYIKNKKTIPIRLLKKNFPGCKYPYGMMIRLLLETIRLKPKKVVDLTFGEGKFWSCYKPEYLIGYDIRKLKWIIKPDKFIKAPAWAALYHIIDNKIPKPELIAVDPPWQQKTRGKGKKIRYGGKWWYSTSKMVGTPKIVLEAATKLSGKLKIPLIIHYKNRWVPNNFKVLIEVFWNPNLPNTRQDYKTWWGIIMPIK